jgi:hypothetical protein
VRQDLTSRAFEAIRQAQPIKLLVVADGSRNEAAAELCRQARAVTEQVDWDCYDAVTGFINEFNKGCKV